MVLKGKLHSIETRDQISSTLSGRAHSLEHRERISQSLSGRRIKKKTRQRMSDAKKAISAATRLKMSKAKSGANHPLFGLRGTLNPKYGKRYPK